jgi:hypothetical protein
MFTRSVLLHLMIVANWWVRSSSDRPAPTCTDGLTWGGGTGTTVWSIHDGRLHRV